jgi:hypothetical protein
MMTTTRNSDLLPCFCRSRSVLAASQWAGIIFVWYRHWYWVYIYCWYETGVSVRVLSAGRKDGSRRKSSRLFPRLVSDDGGRVVESSPQFQMPS